MARIDMIDHFPWATIIYKELWDSFKAAKIAKKGQTYLSGYAPLLANEAYDKLVMLNEAYEQELIARSIDTMVIKAETEKRFTEQKHIRQKKEEPQIERKDEAKKEEGKEDEAEKEGALGKEPENNKEAQVLRSTIPNRNAKEKKGKGRNVSLWRSVYKAEDQTISRYDMLHLLHGGRLADEAILEGREIMNIEALQKESVMLRAGLAAQIICEDREYKMLRLKLDIDDPKYVLYFGGNDVPLIE
ncbi:uncharacterized protein A4U43_C08F15590 [Asparagus officinalis]|nr:uncharacterized protein A4U43_C08F15590 [Asparagus officinalis]